MCRVRVHYEQEAEFVARSLYLFCIQLIEAVLIWCLYARWIRLEAEIKFVLWQFEIK
jgi:hypothetical protein